MSDEAAMTIAFLAIFFSLASIWITIGTGRRLK